MPYPWNRKCKHFAYWRCFMYIDMYVCHQSDALKCCDWFVTLLTNGSSLFWCKPVSWLWLSLDSMFDLGNLLIWSDFVLLFWVHNIVFKQLDFICRRLHTKFEFLSISFQISMTDVYWSINWPLKSYPWNLCTVILSNSSSSTKPGPNCIAVNYEFYNFYFSFPIYLEPILR